MANDESQRLTLAVGDPEDVRKRVADIILSRKGRVQIGSHLRETKWQLKSEFFRSQIVEEE